MLFNQASCYVVAEIGGNFSDVATGIKLVDAAADAGADAIKLQTYRSKTITSRYAMFDMENTNYLSQEAFFRRHELSEEAHKRLFSHASQRGLGFFSTPSHPEDVEMLERLGVPCYKIGADDANNLPFLRYVAKTGKPVIFSTGMCTIQEVRKAVETIISEGNRQIILLHTISGYPTHPHDVNLRAMLSLKQEFPQFPVGFSDHTLGIWASLAAATLGAALIERHFTLDRHSDGPDHMLSSEPQELAVLVRQIRLMECMMGSDVKGPYGPEVKNRRNNRKSLVAMRAIAAGTVLTTEDIWPKRPGTGIEPKFLDMFLGRAAARDIPEDTILTWNDIR